jgi:flagellar biogenesis protein FliO
VKINIFLILIIFLFFCISYTEAQTVATDSPGLSSISEPLFLEESVATMPFAPNSDPFTASLRVVTALIIVIIIALALSWFIQKKGGFGSNVFGKVIGILPLDNRRVIYLVDIVGRVLVLGVTDSNINLLCEINDKDTLDSLRLQGSTANVPGMEKLFSFLKKANRQSIENGDLTPQVDESDFKAQTEKNQERLRKINSLLVKRNLPEKDKE